MYELYQMADYKQMITSKYPEGILNDTLKEWWFEQAQNLKHLPGFMWYTVLHLMASSPFGPPAFDGFEELCFGSLKEMVGLW